MPPSKFEPPRGCAAFDRAEARACDHYEEGRDGFCKWTIRPARKGSPDLVTGDCYCDRAERDFRKEEESNRGSDRS